MDDDKLDLSALDPTRDRLGWERRIAAVAARGVAARRRPLTVAAQLGAWRRPALAVATALAAASWLAVFAGERWGSGEPAASAEILWSRWTLGEEVPKTSEIFAMLEASHDR
jgi:hypothetical protein